MGDMIRDSIQFLIIGMLLAVVFLITTTFADYIWAHSEGEPVASKHVVWLGLGLSVVVGLIVLGITSVGAIVEGKAYRQGSHIPWQNAILMGLLFMANWVWNMSRRRPSNKETLLIGVCVIALGTLGATTNALWFTINSDLPADIYPIDKELCGGRYTVLWLGESRMVARCSDTQRIVVKTSF